jgi:hypothetical protein
LAEREALVGRQLAPTHLELRHHARRRAQRLRERRAVALGLRAVAAQPHRAQRVAPATHQRAQRPQLREAPRRADHRGTLDEHLDRPTHVPLLPMFHYCVRLARCEEL